ncbi:hypothetical protein [Anaerobacillus alkaliphilus]|nr:hypothetical protein [Anaerobacillus alkaliphilus]
MNLSKMMVSSTLQLQQMLTLSLLKCSMNTQAVQAVTTLEN